ncbi:HAD-IB family hydrolase [Myceligenerans crystallogenes]|uniref:HAD-IB family hydrolase n=1 Tax=Myceligenerans crystallogenes TaxID=316335 RepID=A0ABP4ZTV6_9MICO
MTNVAFFDVDGTLTARSTMWSFLEFYLTKAHNRTDLYRAARRRFDALKEQGKPRADLIRAYFCSLADSPGAEVFRLGNDWFQTESRQGSLFHAPVLAELRAHRASGARTVLVSSAFPAALAPIARNLGVDDVWCTSPEIRNGNYTGRLAAPPMIGEYKATAVRLAATSHRADPSNCTAYGDHVSDVPMLTTVGKAVVVGNDSTLTRIARGRGWRRLPGPQPASET